MASICVFCGSRAGNNPSYTSAAVDLADAIAENGHTLIYGGGSVGLMGHLADRVLAASGHVIGVIPVALAKSELMHPRVPDMRVVPDMHIRKATMHQLADAYVALPGGYGTLEELFEVLCWAQLEFHTAPVAVLNQEGFYAGVLSQLDRMVDEGFLSHSHREIITAVCSSGDLRTWLSRQFPVTSRDT